jgi:glycosyltransferase involved in cell wall biosynthesis
LRILHAVLSEGFYGSERYCGELAHEQARRGHEVAVVTLGHASDCTRALRSLTARALPTRGRMRLTTIPRTLPAVLHRPFAQILMHRFRPHIVHTHLDPAARRIGGVARRRGIPHVATLHLNFSAPEYGACDGLVCIADWQRKTLPADFASAVAVIRNWLPAAVTDALSAVTADTVADLRRQWRADDQGFVFGSVGRLVPEKGMDALVRGFRQAFPKGLEPVRLVIVGDGPQRGALRELAAADTRIVLAGAQANVAPFYRAFDTYVSAARFEPFGIAILEAMGAGCPLVLTRSQGPREFVSDPRTRWIDDVSDAALASALVEAAAAGRRRFTYELSRFSPERAVAEIEELYARVMANQLRATPRGADR